MDLPWVFTPLAPVFNDPSNAILFLLKLN